MTRRWDALNSRARGLRTHLLTRRDLERLSEAPDLAALGDLLRAAGFSVAEAGRIDAGSLDLAVRRRAGAQLALLSHWTEANAATTAILFDDEDRSNVRAMLRGAAAGADSAERLACTVPTPSLPERALAELARQPTPRAVAALLSVWRHPLGRPLNAAIGAGQIDLFQLELALSREVAVRALRLAGRGPLLAYVRESIDIENALAALVVAERPADLTPKDAFITGGERVGIRVFEEAVQTGSTIRAAARLAHAFGKSPIAHALDTAGGDVGAAETAVLRGRIAELRRAARRDPLGPAPLLVFVLGLRAEIADLRRIIWGFALGAPRPRLTADLATVT